MNEGPVVDMCVSLQVPPQARGHRQWTRLIWRSGLAYQRCELDGRTDKQWRVVGELDNGAEGMTVASGLAKVTWRQWQSASTVAGGIRSCGGGQNEGVTRVVEEQCQRQLAICRVLSCRVETWSLLSPICNLKNPNDLSKTRKGSSYRGMRGGVIPSCQTRMYWARRSSSSFS
jgi:hypothetical protein